MSSALLHVHFCALIGDVQCAMNAWAQASGSSTALLEPTALAHWIEHIRTQMNDSSNPSPEFVDKILNFQM